jgi:hypothetical protein
MFMNFFAVPMGVDDQQSGDDKSARQQHNEDGLVVPDLGHQAGKFVNHPSQRTPVPVVAKRGLRFVEAGRI